MLQLFLYLYNISANSVSFDKDKTILRRKTILGLDINIFKKMLVIRKSHPQPYLRHCELVL